MVSSKSMAPLPNNFLNIFWRNQFRTKIHVPGPTQELKGKTGIVTGANSGLGFASAQLLLNLGLSHLVMAVRSTQKGEDAASKLRPTYPDAKIDVWNLDMESYFSIQTFANRCKSDLPNIDFVILNAGLSAVTCRISSNIGHETTIQVNHLSTALLTLVLLPVIASKSSPANPARLTVVNSLSAHMASFPNRDQSPLLSAFDDTRITPWNPQERYGVSKLLNQLFLAELTDKIPPDRVVINMVEPGMTKGTALARDAGWLLGLVVKIFFNIAGRPVKQGAATYVDALVGHGKESHGCFIMNKEIAP